MPRRSLRTSSSTATPTKPAAKVPTPLSHASKRSRATPTKSQYFETSNTNGARIVDNSEDSSVPPSPTTVGGETSGYEDEDASASQPTSDDEEDDAFSESDTPPAKRQRRSQGSKATPKAAPPSTAAVNAAKGQELWRQGVKTGLGPGTQVMIEKPKPRAAGSTPYQDHTIHPNTMLFLADLAENNDREWLKMHDPDFRTSWNDFTAFLEGLQERLIGIDETIPELPTKDIVFRIYRDIRFSKDPTPYKAHFSAAWSRTGRKGPYAAYYVQIKPGGSFVGGGLWHPEAQPVAKLRADFDRKPHRIKGVLMNERIRKEFFRGVAANEKKAIAAFAEQNADNALKSKPKGYNADHQDIELLRLRNFTVGRKLRDEEVLGSKGMDRIADLLSCLAPFVGYLNSVVMPDEESSSSDDDDEDVNDASSESENDEPS